ncbi:aldehyde dehydrogenase family protein [Xanthomonas campestris pv. phormiicola]|nr:aldehyde dehydrogenase family protein [Xanthomonas campestris pv. phormiicola]UYC15826.1 aldehyde dehydrogenase family protein [Xanthomonas campestris pv. phormiicola]
MNPDNRPVRPVALPTACNFIGGRFVDAPDTGRIDVRDPASGDVIGDIPRSDAATVDRAVNAARSAFDDPAWRDMPPCARERLLHRFAELLEADAANLAALESLDSGKPIAFSSGIDVPYSVAWLRYYAGWPSKLTGKTQVPAIHGPNFHAYTLRQPVGVVGLIVPWNYPLVLAVWKLAPALAAGCTVLLKPAQNTPYSALRLAEFAAQAGFPPGVFNVVLGDAATGQAIVDHPGVAKISFTGSTRVGKQILASVARDLKRVTLELGGKSPTILLPDADLESAIPGAAQSAFVHAGQICFAGTRLFAPRKQFDKVLEGVAQVAAALPIGDPLDPATLLGPVISQVQLDAVLGKVEASVKAGAAVFSGGHQAQRPGYYIAPTILVTEDTANPGFRDEFFGPVLMATPYDDLDQVAAMANDSDYGLAAHIHTRDLAAAHQLARRLQAGTVWINTQLSPDPSMPFGGFKQSGWGRENGEDVFDHYLETKSVIARIG